MTIEDLEFLGTGDLRHKNLDAHIHARILKLPPDRALVIGRSVIYPLLAEAWKRLKPETKKLLLKQLAAASHVHYLTETEAKGIVRSLRCILPDCIIKEADHVKQ